MKVVLFQLARQIQTAGPTSSYWSYWGMDSLASLATNIIENLQVSLEFDLMYTLEKERIFVERELL